MCVWAKSRDGGNWPRHRRVIFEHTVTGKYCVEPVVKWGFLMTIGLFVYGFYLLSNVRGKMHKCRLAVVINSLVALLFTA